jgi:hypothetical protein
MAKIVIRTYQAGFEPDQFRIGVQVAQDWIWPYAFDHAPPFQSAPRTRVLWAQNSDAKQPKGYRRGDQAQSRRYVVAANKREQRCHDAYHACDATTE